MRKKRLLIIGGSVVAITVAGLLVAPSFVDWSKYQTLATTKIAESTGYEVNINGPLRVSLLPRPSLSVREVSVKKPNPNRAVTLASFSGVDVSIALLPLLTGSIDISSITLDSPNIQLVKYKDGTDNWSPISQAPNNQAQEESASTPKAEKTALPDIAINALNIKGGTLAYTDEQTGDTQKITIERLKLKADAITGPFAASGLIAYQNAAFKIDLSTGGYRAGESMPVRLVADDSKSRLSLTWNGIFNLEPEFEAQGETALKFSDIGGVLADAGIAADVPKLPPLSISGMLTASPAKASLANSAIQLDKTRFTGAFEWQKSTTAQNIKARIETHDIVDVDALLKQIPAAKPNQDAAKVAQKTESEAAAPFLPANLTLPSGMQADISLKAGGLKYKGQNTGSISLEAALPANAQNVSIRMNLAEIPGNAEIAATATLVPGKTPALRGNFIGTLPNLKATLADWLQVVDAKTLAQPGLPTRANAELEFVLSGQSATANLSSVSLGETRLNGAIRYRKAAPRPNLSVKIEANLLNLPSPQGGAAPSKGGKSASDKPFAISAPALPFDLEFDLKLGRFARGDEVLTDIAAAGTFAGKSLSLLKAEASTRGGTVLASGRVNDIEALSGVDAKAALHTQDLESFYKALTGQALPIEQKIGAFKANAQVRGDTNKLDANLSAEARGFTFQASGVIDDPLNANIPASLNIKLQHNDYIQAMRTFAPDFGSGSGAPLNVSADLAIKNNVYDLTNFSAKMGKSDLSGNLRANMSGSKPAFSAKLASTMLDLASFIGGDSKPPAGNASAIHTVSANSGAKWSKDPINTNLLNAMNLDVEVKAQKLSYGTWLLNDVTLNTKMADGSLRLNPLSAKIYGGTFNGDISASAPKGSTSLTVSLKADGKDAQIGDFLSALTSSPKKMADGVGGFNIDIRTNGNSPAALVSAANGKADISTSSLVVYGMDLDKLAANLVEAFDGGWKGVLSAIPAEGLAKGSTSFKNINHSFPVQGGVVQVKDFKLETLSSNAKMSTNGNVDFPLWTLYLDSQVQVTQPKDVPVLGVRLSGPLNAPQKNINSSALDNLLRERVGGQVNKLIEKNIKDENIRGLVGGILGIQPAQPQAPKPELENAPAAPAAPVAPEEGAASAARQQQPLQAPAPTQQKTPEQQLIEGLGGLLKKR